MISSFLVFLLVIATCRTEAVESRLYNNPLNGKTLDLWLLVDETNSRLSIIQLEQMKIALNSIVTELASQSASPNIRIFFYGATSAVHQVVSAPTASASVIKSSLSLKQYTYTQPNPSTLISALNAVNSSCWTNCRTKSRVTVVFSTAPDAFAEARIRQLEHEHRMTIIVVGIGSDTSVLNLLASHPSRIYAIPFRDFVELMISAPLISSLVTVSPRFLIYHDLLNYGNTKVGVYYTVQLETLGYTNTNDSIIMFTSNCSKCPIYASLSEPNPIEDNAAQIAPVLSLYPPGYAMFYFRVPKFTRRVFLSLLGNGQASVGGIFGVFSLPKMLQNMVEHDLTPDLTISIG